VRARERVERESRKRESREGVEKERERVEMESRKRERESRGSRERERERWSRSSFFCSFSPVNKKAGSFVLHLNSACDSPCACVRCSSSQNYLSHTSRASCAPLLLPRRHRAARERRQMSSLAQRRPAAEVGAAAARPAAAEAPARGAEASPPARRGGSRTLATLPRSRTRKVRRREQRKRDRKEREGGERERELSFDDAGH
jgi:hypothetical protein